MFTPRHIDNVSACKYLYIYIYIITKTLILTIIGLVILICTFVRVIPTDAGLIVLMVTFCQYLMYINVTLLQDSRILFVSAKYSRTVFIVYAYVYANLLKLLHEFKMWIF